MYKYKKICSIFRFYVLVDPGVGAISILALVPYPGVGADYGKRALSLNSPRNANGALRS